MGFPTVILSIMTGAVSAAALFISGSSIPRLRKYEDKAEKAAEWSNIAEERLWNTRYTVGAGIAAVSTFFPPYDRPLPILGIYLFLVCLCPFILESWQEIGLLLRAKANTKRHSSPSFRPST